MHFRTSARYARAPRAFTADTNAHAHARMPCLQVKGSKGGDMTTRILYLPETRTPGFQASLHLRVPAFVTEGLPTRGSVACLAAKQVAYLLSRLVVLSVAHTEPSIGLHLEKAVRDEYALRTTGSAGSLPPLPSVKAKAGAGEDSKSRSCNKSCRFLRSSCVARRLGQSCG